jgi:acyl transferase domain-containing protein
MRRGETSPLEQSHEGASHRLAALETPTVAMQSDEDSNQHDPQRLNGTTHSESPHGNGKPPSVDTRPVYINGFAIRGPGFKTASKFFDGLLDKRDMSTETMHGRERFDHSFFRISVEQATYTDPQIRFLLELTYDALVEAGVNDFSALPSADVGVYVGSSFSDFHQATLEANPVEGYEHIGAAGAMTANSISRFFGFGGASMKIDSACSSSLQALDMVSL